MTKEKNYLLLLTKHIKLNQMRYDQLYDFSKAKQYSVWSVPAYVWILY